MQITTLGSLFSHPSFLILFLAILFTLANVLIGVSLLSRDKKKRGYSIHRYVYWGAVGSLCLYVLSKHYLLEATYLDLFVLVYFLLIIPYSRTMEETQHAVIASVGLVLLLGTVAFTIL
ncbi:MAG: hypothetical protein G3M78_12000 [Candidatus Nitrohelix vancouverensis]|uniref:Uncharacterized protein n=1 Tax=Candidatus Nitrohelix vancouverensis TaxID=2705534 RepID=A0A7T0C3Y7_9BACT|nr:MAG: hypothetical protein G3M78_12000 [Candidatus Nitrohelix vancouverensis]